MRPRELISTATVDNPVQNLKMDESKFNVSNYPIHLPTN